MGYLGDYMVRVTIWKLNMNYLPEKDFFLFEISIWVFIGLDIFWWTFYGYKEFDLCLELTKEDICCDLGEQ